MRKKTRRRRSFRDTRRRALLTISAAVGVAALGGVLYAGLLVYALRARLVAERSCPTSGNESAGP